MQQVQTSEWTERKENQQGAGQGRRKTEKGTFALSVTSLVYQWLAFKQETREKKTNNKKKTLSDRYRAEQCKQDQFLCTTLAKVLLLSQL